MSHRLVSTAPSSIQDFALRARAKGGLRGRAQGLPLREMRREPERLDLSSRFTV